MFEPISIRKARKTAFGGHDGDDFKSAILHFNKSLLVSILKGFYFYH